MIFVGRVVNVFAVLYYSKSTFARIPMFVYKVFALSSPFDVISYIDLTILLLESG